MHVFALFRFPCDHRRIGEVGEEAQPTSGLRVLCTRQSNGDIYYMEHLSKKIKTSDRRRLEETKSRSDLRILRLYIPFIANSDFGEYKCFAANKLGQSEVHMSLSGDYFNIIFISLSSFIFLPFY